MKINKINFCIARFSLAIIIFLFSSNVFGNVTLPAIFSDHMVLQQQSKVAVWGWAAKGEEISVSGSWASKICKVKADAGGNWKVMVQTPPAGGPYLLTIKGNNIIKLADVLIGEVWVCSGQSNMVFSLKSSDSASAEIANANFSQIRYFSVERQYGTRPFKDAPGSVWQKTSPGSAPSFSAVAYYFAKKIHQSVKVPVGIIYAAWGGTPAEAWTPESVLKNDSSLSLYINRWKFIQENVGRDSTDYHFALTKWENKSKTADSSSSKKPEEPQTFYYYKRPWRQPGVLFNGMINPLIPYSIKGVLWYQGESNVGYADEYEELFTKMIHSWREKWYGKKNKRELPFYFVQIAPFGYSNLAAAARLREGQSNVTKKLKHTGMAVPVDVGNMKDIHFTHKKEVGERLALIALANDYGFKQVVFSGPVNTSISLKGGKLHLKFDQLLETINNEKPGGFEIGYQKFGSDELVFEPAESVIRGNEILVWNEKIKYPLMVRYAWLEIGKANIVNKSGLPASPFRKQL